MPKTLVEKLESPRPDVAIFKITGTLGYHENSVIEKFLGECERKGVTSLVLDFSELTSLGGGCARLIGDAAAEGKVGVTLVGASKTARTFLEKGGKSPIAFVDDLDEALENPSPPSGGSDTGKPVTAPPSEEQPGGVARDAEVPPAPAAEDSGTLDVEHDAPIAPDPAPSDAPEFVLETSEPPIADGHVADIAAADRGPKEGVTDKEATDGRVAAATSEPAPAGTERTAAAATIAGTPGTADKSSPTDGSSGDDSLNRKLIRYRALLSLNSDLNRIREKPKLLNALLLSTMAQVGVESAAFLELRDDAFVAAAWKGFETADPGALSIRAADVDLKEWSQASRVIASDDPSVPAPVGKVLDTWAMPHLGPFVVHGELRGLVLLGRTIRNDMDDGAKEFLAMIMSQAAVAYENCCRYEAESERTLGLVHSLISLIEDNTVSRGSTERVVSYVQAVATACHYPEEHMRDLLYGTVLRDIGMIKISDLIVRTPRELVDEEWEIIKRHPIDGAAMLQSMNFTDHTVDIVHAHHERFNGDGYPEGLQGPAIPLGARIISIAESYVAMLHDRPTRPALSEEEALNTLKENWGNRYDPEVVDAFVGVVEEEIRSGEPLVSSSADLFKV